MILKPLIVESSDVSSLKPLKRLKAVIDRNHLDVSRNLVVSIFLSRTGCLIPTDCGQSKPRTRERNTRMDRGSVRHENAKEAVIFIDPMSLGYKYFQIHSIIENLFPHLSRIHHLMLSFKK